MFALFFVVIFMIFLTNYLLYKALGYEKAWLGFIPFFCNIPLIDIAGMNRWYILLTMIPVVNVVFAVILMAVPMKQLNGSIMIYTILSCVAGCGIFYLWYLLYSYNPNKEEKEEYEG